MMFKYLTTQAFLTIAMIFSAIALALAILLATLLAPSIAQIINSRISQRKAVQVIGQQKYKSPSWTNWLFTMSLSLNTISVLCLIVPVLFEGGRRVDLEMAVSVACAVSTIIATFIFNFFAYTGHRYFFAKNGNTSTSIEH